MKKCIIYSVLLVVLIGCESVSDIGLLRTIEIAQEIEQSNLPKGNMFSGVVKMGNYYFTSFGNLYYRAVDQKLWDEVGLPTQITSADWRIADIYLSANDEVWTSVIHTSNQHSYLLKITDPTNAVQNTLIPNGAGATPFSGQISHILGILNQTIYVLKITQSDTTFEYAVYGINTGTGAEQSVGTTNALKKTVFATNNKFFSISDSALYIIDLANSPAQLTQINILQDADGDQINVKDYRDIALSSGGNVLVTAGTYNDNRNDGVLLAINPATTVATANNITSLQATPYDPDAILYSSVTLFPFNGTNYILIGNYNDADAFFRVYTDIDIPADEFTQYVDARRPISLRNVEILQIDYFTDTNDFFVVTARNGLWRFRFADFSQNSVQLDINQELDIYQE